jgi:hypothetical protein
MRARIIMGWIEAPEAVEEIEEEAEGVELEPEA